MIRNLQVDPTTRSRLGADVLAKLGRNLHAVACQTCGRPFGRAEAPALVVFPDGPDRATATVHHQGCHDPEWTTEWSTAAPPPRTHLTWHSNGLVTPRGERPAVVVNPSYEEAVLLSGSRGGHGGGGDSGGGHGGDGDGGDGWRFGNPEEFGAIGLTSVEALDDEHAAGLEAVLGIDRLVIEAPGHPLGPWSLAVGPDDEFTRAALRVGRVLVVFTTVDDVRTPMPPNRFSKLLAREESLAGVVTVSFAPEVQTPRPYDLDPELRIELFASTAVRIEEALDEDPSDECIQAALAADDGDDELVRGLGARERLFGCLLLAEFYTLTSGAGPDSPPRAREGTHVVLPSAEQARGWAEVFRAVCGPAGASVQVLDTDGNLDADPGSDPDAYLGDIVLGTAPGFGAAAAASPLERGWSALFVDVEPDELGADLVRRYRRVLTV